MRVNKARLSLPSFMARPIQKAIRWIIGRIKTAISGFSKRASGMPVPSSMADLSVTESSNSPSGSDAISTGLDNYLRAIQAIVRTTNHKGADIASAASVAIGAATGEFVTVTGTTTITSFDSVSAGIVRTVLFSGELTIAHSSNIQMPGASDYLTAAGDVAIFRSLGGGQWKCVSLLSQSAQIYTISISSDGTKLSSSINASAWTSAKIGTGSYRITHNLGLSSGNQIYVIPTRNASGFAYNATRDPNDFVVNVTDPSGVAEDGNLRIVAHLVRI